MKKPTIVTISIISFFLILILTSAYYFFFYTPSPNANIVTLKNPIEDLTDAQALEQFDESFVLYLLASIGAQNLHNPPLSSNTPKIEIQIENQVYNAEIKKGSIKISVNPLNEKDVIIKTTKLEAIKMLRSKSYIAESFYQGTSTIELIASKTRLLAKGYSQIYSSITGNQIS